MSYDDVEIEDMEWNEELNAFTYPCPCGDLFQITKEELAAGEEIARCPSCSLYITVVYDPDDFQEQEPPVSKPEALPEIADSRCNGNLPAFINTTQYPNPLYLEQLPADQIVALARL